MSDELEPLADDLAGALATERARPGLTAEAQARLVARIGAAVAVAPVAPAPAPAPNVLGAKVVAVALASLATGGVLGAAGVTLLRPVPVPERVVVEKVVVKEVRVEVPVPVVEPVAPVNPVKRVEPPSEDGQLAAERVLVEAARVALTRGHADEALTQLGTHERRFRAGRLAEERESLAIQALLSLGKTDEAKARAAKFRAAYPTSLLRPLIDALVP